MYVCMHECMQIYMYVCMYVYVCMFVCMYICMYICMFVCMYMMYVFICIFSMFVCMDSLYVESRMVRLTGPASIACMVEAEEVLHSSPCKGPGLRRLRLAPALALAEGQVRCQHLVAPLAGHRYILI